jgi:hypothetical protein
MIAGPEQRRRSMSTQAQRRTEEQRVSGWAIGGVAFAASVMTLIGVFQALSGLVAILDDQFYVVTRNYTFDLDVTAWGWIHLVMGLAIFSTGIGLFGRRAWAGVTALVLTMLSAIANFFFIPYYPAWALLVIGLDVWVIWALTRPGAIRT